MYNGTIVTAKGRNGQARVRLVQNSINANANTSNVTLFYEVYPQNMTNFSSWTWGQTWGAHNVNDSYIDPMGNGDITSPAKPTANNTWKTVGSKTFTVTHNEKGVATVYVEFAFNGGDATHTLLVSGEGSATIENTFKATTPTVTFNTQARALNMGTAGTITLPRNSTRLTHKLTFKFGSTTQTLTTNAGASYSWTPAIATYAPQIPNSTTGSGTITCETYNGSTKIGSNTTCVAWLAVPSSVIPTATVTTSDTTGLLATYGGYVQGKSTLQVVVAGTGVQSSTIKSYSSTFNSTTKSGATNTYATTKAGTLAVQGSVTDSRGRVGTRSVNITVLPYANPQIASVSADRVDENGNSDPNGAYIKVSAEGTVASLNDHNSKVFKIRYRRVGTSTWSTWTTADTTTFAANVDYAYDIQVQLADDFTSVTVARQVPGTFVLVDYGGMEGVEGTGIAFGAAATKANTFLNYLNMESYGTVLVGDDDSRGWAGIQFQSGSYTSLGIRAYDNGTAYGHNMLIQSGGLLILGGGEYAANRYAESDLQGQDLERTYLGSDNEVVIEAGGNTIANRRTWSFTGAGQILHNVQEIDLTTTPSSRAVRNVFVWNDTNGTPIGQLGFEVTTSDQMGVILGSRRNGVFNQLGLQVDASGNRRVWLDAPGEWRTALGMATSTTAPTITAASNFTISGITARKQWGMVQLMFNVKTTNALTANTNYTVGTISTTAYRPAMEADLIPRGAGAANNSLFRGYIQTGGNIVLRPNQAVPAGTTLYAWTIYLAASF